MAALDDLVDSRHAAAKLYLARMLRNDLSEAETLRARELIAACVKLEQVGDIISRGAGFGDISKEFGAFLIYMVVALILFCAKFFSARRALLKHRAKEEKHRLQQLNLADGTAMGQAE